MDELRTAHTTLVSELGALNGTDLQITAPMPYGDVPIGALLDVCAMDAGIHGSDLADALGAAAPLSGPVVKATKSFLATFLPVLAQQAPTSDGLSLALVGDMVRLGITWREGQLVVETTRDPTATVEGDDTSVLLFAPGRLALDDGSLRVHGDRDLAVDFKNYVPGP